MRRADKCAIVQGWIDSADDVGSGLVASSLVGVSFLRKRVTSISGFPDLVMLKPPKKTRDLLSRLRILENDRPRRFVNLLQREKLIALPQFVQRLYNDFAKAAVVAFLAD